jgi:general secretion pathway protein A
MYNRFFGLQKNPFGMTPDPAFLFLTVQHREALAGLTYALLGRKGFLVLTGDAGTGKTTLMARVVQHLPKDRVQFSVILNPTLTAAEFLEMVLLDYGVESVPASKAQRLTILQKLLTTADDQGKTSALMIDEAHKLKADVLEEIRLLGNYERSDRKLLQILFLGQDELGGMLNTPGLRQLKQRIAARFAIGPLGSHEVEQYIQFRWTKAGGAEAPFTPESIRAIGLYSKGIPRVINAICDNALMLAFAEGINSVRGKHVREAATDLDFAGVTGLVDHAGPPRLPASLTDGPPAPRIERLAGPDSDQSFIARWAGRLGLAH